MSSALESLIRLSDVSSSGVLAELCRRHDLDLLVIFGSAANLASGAPEPGDIDLAVASRDGGPVRLLPLLEDLAELIGGDHLDIMDLALADPVAAHRALTHAEVLFEGSPHAFTERQIFAIVHYIDTEPLRRAVLESLAR